jgi:hypothetical protein
MSGMMTNSIDRDQWLNVTSESRDRISRFFDLGRNRTRDPRVPGAQFLESLENIPLRIFSYK